MKYKNDIESLIKNLDALKNNFPKDFSALVSHITSLKGDVITMGIGKSGIIANKLSSTLCSVGVRSFFVHPVEAVHGDLGRIRKNDLCIIISHSGNSSELRGFLNYCEANSIAICAITCNTKSYLADKSKYLLSYDIDKEICPNNLAPTVSTTVALTICDLIAVETIRKSNFSEIDFRKFHPGGSLGSLLEPVSTISQSLDELMSISENEDEKELLNKLNSTKFGLVIIKDGSEIRGIITDGDYRRSVVKKKSFSVSDILIKDPISIESNATIKDLKRKFSKNSVNIIFVSKSDKLNGFVHVSQVAQI